MKAKGFSLISVALALAAALVWVRPIPRADGETYQITHRYKDLYKVLHALRDGDSISTVRYYIGEGLPAWSGLYDRTRKDANAVPQYYPHGFKEGDEIFVYPVLYRKWGGSTVSLQFRDGKLINFHPEFYRKWIEPEVYITF